MHKAPHKWRGSPLVGTIGTKSAIPLGIRTIFRIMGEAKSGENRSGGMEVWYRQDRKLRLSRENARALNEFGVLCSESRVGSALAESSRDQQHAENDARRLRVRARCIWDFAGRQAVRVPSDRQYSRVVFRVGELDSGRTTVTTVPVLLD